MQTLNRITHENHKLIGFLFGLAIHPAVQSLLALVRP